MTAKKAPPWVNPEWLKSDSGLEMPPVFLKAFELILTATLDSRLYQFFAWCPLYDGSARKEKLHRQGFWSIQRVLCSLLFAMNADTMAAGKRTNGQVIGYGRSEMGRRSAMEEAQRTISRVLGRIIGAGLATRQRRSAAGSLYGISHHVFQLLGLKDWMEQYRSWRAQLRAKRLAQLAERGHQDQHTASSGARREAGEAQPLAAYLPGAPPD